MTLSAGTYIFSEVLNYADITAGEYPINFTSRGNSYGSMILLWQEEEDLIYQDVPGESPSPPVYDYNGWTNDDYRTFTTAYDQTVTDAFGEWILANSEYDSGEITITIKQNDVIIAQKSNVIKPIYSINWFESSPSAIQMDLHGDMEDSIIIPTEYGDRPEWLAFADPDGNIFDDPTGATVNWTEDVTLGMIVVGAPPVLTVRDRQGAPLVTHTSTGHMIDQIELTDLTEGRATISIDGERSTINYGVNNLLRGLAYSLTSADPDIFPGVTEVEIDSDTDLYIVTAAKPGSNKMTFYQCYADNNRVNKVPYMSNPVEVEGTFRDAVSITDPVVEVEGNITGHNYVYIPNFGRYYYITDIVCTSAELFEVHLHVDVLMSFRTELLGAVGMVERNQYLYDPMLPDGRLPLSREKIAERIDPTGAIVSPFSKTYMTYVFSTFGKGGN